MTFDLTLANHFPGTMTESDFINASYWALADLGIDRDRGLACVSVCRDELTAPLIELIQKTWGEAFNFSSLGGMLFLGKTGFLAAQHHAPIAGGRERYVFLTFPHIAIDSTGAIGRCTRPGRSEASSACGALVAFQNELADGRANLGLDPDDVEQSLLKQRLIGRIEQGEAPDLVTLTRLAYEAILEDLQHMIELTVHPDTADFAVLSGIQIHGPNRSYIWPGALYAVIGGERREISLR